MKLRDEQSKAVRRFAKNVLAESSADDCDLAAQVFPHLSQPTVYRLLNTDQILTDEHANILLHGIAYFTDLEPKHLWAAMDDPFNPFLLPITELMECVCVRIDGDEVHQLENTIVDVLGISTAIAIYDRTLLPLFLDDEVAESVVASRVKEFARDSGKAMTLLRDITQQIRDAFMMMPVSGNLANIRTIATLCGLTRIARQRLPFSDCSPDEIDASFGSLIQDAIVERKVSMSTLDDRSPGPAREWAWRREKFASVAVFSSGLVVKRKRGTMTARIINAGYSSVSQKLFDDHSRDFVEAESLACHGPTAKQTINFLQHFLKSMGRPIFERPSMS